MSMKRAMVRPLRFVFEFPPVHGVFDAGYGVVYIFGGLHESEIEDIIVHETLHYVLLRVAGKRASLKLDRIYTQVDNEV
jgi:hypothetical protein